MERLGAIILCGGESTRMGYPKWKLPLGQSTLLQHIVQTISTSVSKVVVCPGVSGLDIQIDNVHWALDEFSNCGPLEGIRVGLKYLAEECEFAFVTACDTPFPMNSVLGLLLHKIQNNESAIPVGEDHVYGMSGMYRTAIHPQIESLIQRGQLRVSRLAEATDSVLVPLEEIRRVDPNLDSIYNINRPQDYRELLDRLGLECDARIWQTMNRRAEA